MRSISEAIYSFITKVKIAKDIIHLQMWIFFAILSDKLFANWIEQIQSKYLKLMFQPVHKLQVLKFGFDWISRLKWQQKSHLKMDIFFHFIFCHNRKNSFSFFTFLWSFLQLQKYVVAIVFFSLLKCLIWFNLSKK